MSDIEEGIDSDASEEGEIELVSSKDESDDSDDDNDEEDEIESLNWSKDAPKGKKTKKDILKEVTKLKFNPSSILESFDNFMTRELKQLIVDYTNLKGKLMIISPSLSFLSLPLSLSLSY